MRARGVRCGSLAPCLRRLGVMKMDPVRVERRAFDRRLPRDLEVAHGDDDVATLRLIDISLGGFSVTSTRRFAPGLARTFQFTSGGIFTLTLRAVAIRADRHETARGGGLYTCGFAFVAPTDEVRDTIAMVVNGLANGVFAEWPAVTFADAAL